MHIFVPLFILTLTQINPSFQWWELDLSTYYCVLWFSPQQQRKVLGLMRYLLSVTLNIAQWPRSLALQWETWNEELEIDLPNMQRL